MATRELSSFLLPPLQRQKLQSAGFQTAQDVIELKPSELSAELGIPHEDALSLLKLVREETEKAGGGGGGEGGGSHSALDILREEQNTPSIITFSQQLDELLGGGVPMGKITEFAGAPGIGKTQMSMQLAVDVTLPACFGGVGGEALYIDTEGSFIVERARDIASAAVTHCQHITQASQAPEQLEAMESYSIESVLDSIHYMHCHDYTQLVAAMHLLEEFIQQHPRVKLVVIDSIAFHFRHDFADLALRTRLLNGMAQMLIRAAVTHRMAVVLVNQMTTRVHEGGGSSLVPALGESWGHAPTIRVILHWQQGGTGAGAGGGAGTSRIATLYKAPHRCEASVGYQVTLAGIRDVSEKSSNLTPSPTSDDDTDTQPVKRHRTNSS